MKPARLLAVIAIAGPGCYSYEPGSFGAGQPFAGTRTTIGCIDVAVLAARDPALTGPIVTYSFGNRCDHRATLDLATIAVVGHNPAGESIALTAFDPGHELAALPIDGAGYGTETIEYAAGETQLWPIDAGFGLTEVCVELGRIDRAAVHAVVEPHRVCQRVP